MPRPHLPFGVLARLLVAGPAPAEVRFGSHVYIGGHDVSHQSFNRHRRGVFYLHYGRRGGEGCVWRRDGDGSRTQICRFQVLR